MGHSSSTGYVTDEEEYPWFQLCLWACETTTSQSVLRYDISVVKSAIQSLCADGDQLEGSVRGIDSHLKGLSEFTDEETPEESESLDDAPVLVELASALMDEFSVLRTVRFRLVPGVMSEEEFWSRFFAIVRTRILATIN